MLRALEILRELDLQVVVPQDRVAQVFRAGIGERARPYFDRDAVADAPFGHWGTQTFIAGLRCNELIAPWVLNGPMNRAA